MPPGFRLESRRNDGDCPCRGKSGSVSFRNNRISWRRTALFLDRGGPRGVDGFFPADRSTEITFGSRHLNDTQTKSIATPSQDPPGVFEGVGEDIPKPPTPSVDHAEERGTESRADSDRPGRSGRSRGPHRPSAPRLHYPPELPITERRDEIVSLIRDHQVVVITGETGSGKSTQIPKFCLEAGRGVERLIGCTQPRRIAAVTLAARVSDELGPDGPRLVGHKIRFQDRTSRSTRVKFMTDGILLAEAQQDRLFRAYDTIIVDEAHERTLNIDFLLGLLKKLLLRRPDLKVIITSATIDPEKFSEAFGGAPIIEVSGRTYPVEVVYQAPEAPSGEDGEEADDDSTYVDRAVAAVDGLKARRNAGRGGDILVFMPTESDIRETVQRLDEHRYFNTLVLPLFGRLSAGDQQRVFQLTSEEKIIVSTNVAETSVTIPRIRYVVDTGLARMAQYNSKSRTQGLPVTAVSQASADQRKGRCGRVEAGICIRLYSKEDYLSRNLYTPPEIQRSNLAEVILKMLDLRLGSVQDFPFLDPPSPAAVKDGFGVLKELGAVDDHRKLTAEGRIMARLPLDPRLSRILIEARKEGALAEAAVLAAALSVQDPRDRPAEQEAKADQAHAVFRDRRSDLVGLLRIWNACWGFSEGVEGPGMAADAPAAPAAPASPDSGEASGTGPGEAEEPSFIPSVATAGTPRRSQGQVRKFCRERFLSFRRMKEWRDIHEEITEILSEMPGFAFNPSPASYDAIHRSFLSGYLSHIAMKKEKNLYAAAKNQIAMLFPGSGLFNRGGAWIVAGEVVRTSRLFARMAANVEPEWIEAIGRHLARSTYSEPHWERSRGQVAAFERVTLYGLPVVERRKVDYGRINPEEARAIFIRSALVEGDLPKPYAFHQHNLDLVKRIEEMESRTRRRDLLVDEETLARFYEERLPNFSDIRSLDKFLKDGGDRLLRMTEEDLLRMTPDYDALERFPDALEAGEIKIPLRYTFKPGDPEDGVTAEIPVHTLPALRKACFDWLVPGLLVEKVTGLMKGLPKGRRRQLVPVAEAARKVAERLVETAGEGDFYGELSREVRALSGLDVPPGEWDESVLPDHLRMRFEIRGPRGNVLGSGRDFEALRPLAVARHDDDLWKRAKARWERKEIASWDFGDLPERIEVGEDAAGNMRYAYPGLVLDTGSVSIRLFEDPEEASRVSGPGLLLLYRAAFSQELRQLSRDWAFPASMDAVIFFLGGRASANAALQEYILRELFGLRGPVAPNRERFIKTVEAIRGKITLLGNAIRDEVFDAVKEREAARSGIERFRRLASGNPGLAAIMKAMFTELEELFPPDFLRSMPREFIRELPRYCRAHRLRAERAYAAPEKDRVKAARVESFDARLRALSPAPGPPEDLRRFDAARMELRGLIEEFKISLFAPEIRTRVKVSEKRLDEALREWESTNTSK